MSQCPRCSSHNDPEAAFCGQCGERLGAQPVRRPPSPGERRRRAAAFLGAFLIAILAVVVLCVRLSERPGSRGAPPAALGRRPKPPVEAGSPVNDGAATAGGVLVSEERGEPPPQRLDAAKVMRQVSRALVVLDLRDRDDRPLREIRGVLVDPGGVVLCRYAPLLGTYGGVCRLSTADEAQVPILGLSSRLEEFDLALLRIRSSLQGYPAVPILADDPAATLEVGEVVHAFSDYRPLAATVAELDVRGPDALPRVRLEAKPRLPAETFVAVDAYGYVLGLCRSDGDGNASAPDANLRGGPSCLIDPARGLAMEVDHPAVLSLEQLTRGAYEGTFADLLARGLAALKEKRWEEAIDLLESALARLALESPGDADAARTGEALLQAYRAEVGRRLDAGRSREAAALAEVAVARFAQAGDLWLALGEARLGMKDAAGAVAALSQAQDLAPGAEVDALLERAYISQSGDYSRIGDARSQEGVLIEGLRRLPRSGALYLELAKLYARLELYDDASRFLASVPELDPALRPAAEDLADRIDAALKRLDAVVIPIAGDLRSYKTQAVINGTHAHTFIIDTGATYTTIPSSLAAELGYDTSRADRIQLSTAGGLISAPVIDLDSMNVGGYAVRNLRAVVLPSSIGPPYGLLGLNFLKHFKYTVDASRNEFRLERP